VIRALRWILLIVVLAGAAYLVVGVDFGGATLLDRILGRASVQEPTATATPPVAANETDRLTQKDREGLDRLLESKLQENGEGEASP
jgi:hypothetical protein